MVNIMDLATSKRCLFFFSRIFYFVEEYQHMNFDVQLFDPQDSFLGLCYSILEHC